jgi:circadian clock protein KaiC
MHLLLLHKLIEQYKPKAVVIDPVSSLITVGSKSEVRAMLVRLIDMLKVNQITAMFTSLTHTGASEFDDFTVDAVSSLADTWIKVRNEEQNGERVRSLFIVKSRGMGHSSQLNDFIINNSGIQLLNKSQKQNQTSK